MTGRMRTGIAGWVFADWRNGAFYPEGLPQKQELAYASAALGVIEINGTFRSLQKPQSFRNWAGQAPDDFVFAVKGPQLVTHIKRLKEVEEPLANFFASGPLALGSKLGPFVWQLPPNLGYDPDRLEGFLALLPKTSDAVAALAAQHTDRVPEAYLATDGVGAIRHAIEVRSQSFATPDFVAQLHRHNVALVTADTAEWPSLDLSADFAYCRLQGAPGRDRYEETDLDRWAARIAAWAAGKPMTDGPLLAGPEADPPPRDVFALFVSTDKVHAPKNAQALAARLA